MADAIPEVTDERSAQINDTDQQGETNTSEEAKGDEHKVTFDEPPSDENKNEEQRDEPKVKELKFEEPTTHEIPAEDDSDEGKPDETDEPEETKTDEPEEPKALEEQLQETTYHPSTAKALVPKLSCERLTRNESQDPSYRNLTLPYYVVCRQRYEKAGTRQRLQFLKEIRKQEISQSKALSGVRIHRVFINPVIQPASAKEIIKLTPKQQFKLEQLLKE